jgi:hypothetical protein
MGVVADAATGAAGEVMGVIPRALLGCEIAHAGLADPARRQLDARA